MSGRSPLSFPRLKRLEGLLRVGVIVLTVRGNGIPLDGEVEVWASGSTSSNSERSSFLRGPPDPVLPPTSIDASGWGPTPGASSPMRSGVFTRSSTFTSTPLGPTGLAMVAGSVGTAGLLCQFKRAKDTSSIPASTSMSSSSFSSTVGSVGTSFLSVPVGFFSSSAFFLAAAAALRDASGDARRGKLLSSFPGGV